MDQTNEPRLVRDYTRGYKLRKFVGKLGTWRPPWGIATIPQYVVAATTFCGMLWLWRALQLWSRLGGGLVAAIATVLGILGSTVGAFLLADRRTMIDGRPPTSAALAVLAFLLLRVRHAGRLIARPARLTGCVWLSSWGGSR